MNEIYYIITKGNKLSIYSTKANGPIESAASCVLLTNEWDIGLPAASRESEWHIGHWVWKKQTYNLNGELVTGYAGSSLNVVILPQANSRINCHTT